MSRRGRLASDRLTVALLTIAAAGLRAHCSDHETHHYWTSESEQERKLAVRACHHCPVLQPCLEAATANRESFGVFGGRDFTRPPGRKAA
jgi:Transcription factor WhiB